MRQNDDTHEKTTNEPDEGAVKVPIDDPKAEDAAAQEAASEAEATPAEDVAREADDDAVVDVELDEDAMVEAAIRAGEQAAEEDFANDLDRVKAERDELYARLEEATEQVDSAKKDAKDAVDRLARLQADWDNFRRRIRQERQQEKERAAEKLVLGILPVLDDMERAIEHARQTDDGNEQLTQFVDGVSQVHDKMVGILAKEGVEVIDPTGEAFEPLSHQAVGRVEDKDAYDETVAQVYQRGYRMGGKVIRTAMVTVTYGGPKRPDPEDTDEE